MQEQVLTPPNGIYAATHDYVHGIALGNVEHLVLVSGTMGLDAGGVPAEGTEAQLELIWKNIARILAEASLGLENVVRVTSYLTDRSQVTANETARMAALGTRRVPVTSIVVTSVSEDWLVEIEVIAAA